MSTLSPNEKRNRAAALILLPGAFWLLRELPSGLPSWLPWPTSCGAITGLPCIFCGLTRALHFLLQGDLRRALYFNWLAFPTLLAALAALLAAAVELTLGRRVLPRFPRVPITGKTVSAALSGLFLLWCFQVYLAISQHKQELLNPAGPLYSLVTRF